MYNQNYNSEREEFFEEPTKTVKQQVFDFMDQEDSLPEYQPMRSTRLNFRNSMVARPIPQKEFYTWKPKMPSKKLLE